ncbi:MAG TPA: DNA translocase FtsK, partial [Solirubrobacterales bacterium]
MRKKRAGSARRGKAASKRKAKAKGGLRLPGGLEQRHVDLIALFLVAFGVYLVFVLFFGWEGGKVGYGVETALAYLFGQIGARIFTVLLLLVGGMLLTGTSVSALAGGVGRGLQRVFRGAFAGGDAAARTVARTHADWRQHREARAEAQTAAGPTDVMSAYPEQDEDFEPTVALAEEDDFDTQIFDAETSEEEEPEPETEVELKNYDSDDAVAVVDEGDRAHAGLTPMGNKRGVTMSEEIDYRPPNPKLLERGKNDKGPDPRDHEAVGRKLVETLGHFGVEAKIVGIVSGPHVSRFELRLAPGTKVKKVTELANDIAYALASTDIRILAPIPGKQAVGVEVPNRTRKMVRLGDIYAGRPEETSPLVAWLGKGIDGNPVWTDIAKMPHVLVAGTTGSGKSGCVNAILS